MELNINIPEEEYNVLELISRIKNKEIKELIEDGVKDLADTYSNEIQLSF